jgi:hypothetical protein
MNPQLLATLKKHKFKNGDTITYVALNNEDDKTTPTDIANEIYTTFMGSNVKEQRVMLDAIFDGVYDVIENVEKGAKTKFSLLDKKKMTSTALTVANNGKGGIEFTTDNTNIDIQITINTPEVIAKMSNAQVAKKENDELLKSFGIKIERPLNKIALKKVAELFTNMANM